MDDLKERIARLRELREKATGGEWTFEDGESRKLKMSGDIQMCSEEYYPWVPDRVEDWSFIAAAANDALPLLADCQKRIEKLEQELREDHEATAQTQAAVLKIDQENERLKAQMAEIIAVAHKHNWNGVTNSKILAIFLDQELGDTETLKAQLESAEAALDEIRNIYAGHGHQDIARDYFAKKEKEAKDV